MKKFNLTILFTFYLTFSFAQLITHMSVRVDDNERQGYLELENFWSEIHEQAIKDGLSQRWMVWEFTYEDEEASKGKPDFLVMNFYKDSIQKSKTANLNFKDYAKKVVENAKTLSETLINNGFKIFSGGTDTHLMLLDLRNFKLTGKLAMESLGKANITTNKNSIPFDTESPFITSGIRLGSQAATTRGFGLKEFEKVGELITKVIDGLSKNPSDNSKVEEEVRKEVISLCSSFPIYKNLRK